LLAGTQLIDFAGVTEEEKRQAIEAIEKQTGRVYDTDRGMLLPEE
jgi:hypothetical protein